MAKNTARFYPVYMIIHISVDTQQEKSLSYALWSQTYNVGHNAEFVKRRLSVKENNVSVYHVPFHHVAKPQFLSNLFTVPIFQKPDKGQKCCLF